MNAPGSIWIGIFVLTFLAAGLVKGVTGMGLPTVAMGVLATTMPPAAAAALLVVPTFVTNVWQMLGGTGMRALLRRLWAMMLCVVVGTFLGTRLLVSIDPAWSARLLGLALLGYALHALLAPALSVPARLESRLSPLIGLATGLLAGATGIFTVPAVPYLQALGLQKEDLVQALGLSFTVSTSALAGGLFAHGALAMDQLGLSLLALVPALAGMWLGARIRHRISPQSFRRCFLLLLMLLGLEQMLRSFF